MIYATNGPLTPDEVEANRAERIAAERAAGTYPEPGRTKFAELIAVRDAGQSPKRVKPPFLTPATPEMLKHVGRNQLCPCGSGSKTKWCCG